MNFKEFIGKEVENFLDDYQTGNKNSSNLDDILKSWGEHLESRDYIIYGDYGFAFLMQNVKGFSKIFNKYVQKELTPYEKLKDIYNVIFFIIYDSGTDILSSLFSSEKKNICNCTLKNKTLI